MPMQNVVVDWMNQENTLKFVRIVNNIDYEKSWQVRATEYHQKLGKRKRVKCFYRCGNCRTARVLPRELWNYLRPPACRNCFAKDWRMDMSRYKAWLNRTNPYNTCRCNGLHFNHRAGSNVFCVKSKVPPTEEDYRDRYR